MTSDNKIRDEKIQHDINRATAKIFALSSEMTNKYEYLTGQEILPLKQHKIIQEAKVIYSPLKKALQKQIKQLKNIMKNKLKH